MNEVRRKRKRRKKSRKALWITLIVLVVLVGGGYSGFYYITHRDVQAEDIGVEQDFFDFSDFNDVDSLASEDIGGTADSTDSAAAGSGADKPASDSDKSVPQDNEKTSGTAETAKPESAEDKLKAIETKYTKVFSRLESTALSKLDTLAENALQDYRTGRSVADLSSTYMSAANKLQDKVDGTFYNLLSDMKAELKAGGFNNDLAKKAEAEYKRAIANKKSQMLKKVSEVSG